MTVHRIGGLDLSTSRIGYAAPNGTVHSISAHAGADDPTRRCWELRHGLALTIRRNPPTPTLYIIEDYLTAGGKTLGSTISRIRTGEIGMTVRLMLWDWAIPFVEVDVNVLKRFACGSAGKKGNKERMIAAAVAAGAQLSRPDNDDEADAFHARRIGRCAHGLEPMLHDYERDAVATVGSW